MSEKYWCEHYRDTAIEKCQDCNCQFVNSKKFKSKQIHKWFDDEIESFLIHKDKFLQFLCVQNQCSFDKNDIKFMADKVNLFDDYVSTSKIKALIEEKQQYLSSNLIDEHEIKSVEYFIGDLEQLIKPKDK